MIEKDLNEKLDEISKGIYGVALTQYIDEQIKKIDTVRDAPTLQEVRGREIAVKYMEKLKQRIAKVEEVEPSINEYL